MTKAQAERWAAFRDTYNAQGYEMPADHRHSPAVVIGIGSFEAIGTREDVTVVVRLHPDGRREAITDLQSAYHFADDARSEGRRI